MRGSRKHVEHERRESIGGEFTEHHGNPVSVTGDQHCTDAFVKHGIVCRHHDRY
jgi:hypothetical protein